MYTYDDPNYQSRAFQPIYGLKNRHRGMERNNKQCAWHYTAGSHFIGLNSMRGCDTGRMAGNGIIMAEELSSNSLYAGKLRPAIEASESGHSIGAYTDHRSLSRQGQLQHFVGPCVPISNFRYLLSFGLLSRSNVA